MSQYRLIPLPLEGLARVEHRRRDDARGAFARLYCEDSLQTQGAPFHVRQINRSLTRQRGSVRGLHYQSGLPAESKYITCVRGAVWDVVVDLRRGSPTFLRWHAEQLTAEAGFSLLVPPGFAHGFQTLSDDSELLYLHSADHAPDREGGLAHDDPRLAIDWPLPVINLSLRDQQHAWLDDHFSGLNP